MNPFNYNNTKVLNKFYQNLLGSKKFNTKFLNLSFRKTNCCTDGRTGSLSITDKDLKVLYKTNLDNYLQKQEFMFAFAFIVQNYNCKELTLTDGIGFSTPILEDLCLNCGITYKSPVKLSKAKKDYLYAERMYECFPE